MKTPCGNPYFLPNPIGVVSTNDIEFFNAMKSTINTDFGATMYTVEKWTAIYMVIKIKEN
jgi:hypothetical protein